MTAHHNCQLSPNDVTCRLDSGMFYFIVCFLIVYFFFKKFICWYYLQVHYEWPPWSCLPRQAAMIWTTTAGMRSRSGRGLRTTEAQDTHASRASGFFFFSVIYIYILLTAIYRSTSMILPILPPNKRDERARAGGSTQAQTWGLETHISSPRYAVFLFCYLFFYANEYLNCTSGYDRGKGLRCVMSWHVSSYEWRQTWKAGRGARVTFASRAPGMFFSLFSWLY